MFSAFALNGGNGVEYINSLQKWRACLHVHGISQDNLVSFMVMTKATPSTVLIESALAVAYVGYYPIFDTMMGQEGLSLYAWASKKDMLSTLLDV